MSKHKKTPGDAHSDREKINKADKVKPLSHIRTSLSEERLALIRQRIADNFYDQDIILQEIASQMMRSKEWLDFLNGSRFQKK